ncbi:MAG: hypothetical protein WDO74_36220 [Pseudomonadota bacterium]
MQLDFVNRELTIKLVYYGPALSGKTTNLQALHKAAEPGASGRLMTLETKDDRTLFFDLLPLTFRNQGSLAVRLKVLHRSGSGDSRLDAAPRGARGRRHRLHRRFTHGRDSAQQPNHSWICARTSSSTG